MVIKHEIRIDINQPTYGLRPRIPQEWHKLGGQPPPRMPVANEGL